MHIPDLPYKIQSIQFIGFLIAVLVSYFVTPFVRERAVKLGLLDQPSERRVHKSPTPRLGGISVYLSLFITSLILLSVYGNMNGSFNDFPIYGILAGGTIIFFLGLFDDLEPIGAKQKLLVQFLAASVAWILGVKILHIVNPFFHADFFLFRLSIGERIINFGPVMSYVLTVFWIVAITNAINLVDGIDGLATGVSLISAVTIWAVSVGHRIDQPVGALLAATLAGSLLGFLRWNFNPARIFLGDSGAYLTGFVLSSLTISCVMKSVTLVIMTPMLILIFAIPIIDSLLAVFRRLAKGKHIFEPDREHLHHKILAAGLNQKRAVFVFYVVSALLGLYATYLMSIQSCCRYLILASIVTVLTLFFTFVINWKHQKIFKKLQTDK